ncbi:unnamed protein product, partial [Didymodactylos carnosus]
LNNNSSIRSVRQGLTDNGLSLRFYLHDYLTFPSNRNYPGIVVFTHHHDEVHTAADFQLIQPGQFYMITFRKENYTSLGGSYERCTNEMLSDQAYLMSKGFGENDYGYDQSLCVNLCELKFIYRACGCVPLLHFPIEKLLVNGELKSVSYCNINDSSINNIVKEQMEIFRSTNYQQTCPHCLKKCSSSKYNLFVSSLQAPAHTHIDQLVKEVEKLAAKTNISLPNDFYSNTLEHFRMNYVEMVITAKNNYFVSVSTQQPAYTFPMLIADLGGFLGS